MKRFFRALCRIMLLLIVLVNCVVIFHAYKFTHYYNPGEVSIKEPSHKSAWEKSEDLLFGFNAVKQLSVPPDTVFKKVYFKTSDSLQLEAWLISIAAPKGTVALFHGHGGNKAGILSEAAAFRTLGYNTLLVDFRAHGNSDGNTCTIGYRETEDVQLAYAYLRQSGERNIILWGFSLGAATITKAANDYNIVPQKIILEMPFGSLPGAVRGRIKMMGLPQEPLSSLLTFWGGTLHGFSAFKIEPTAYVKAIKCPVLLQWGRNDLRVSTEETKEIFDNITAAKRLVVFEKSGHQSLLKNEPQKWLREVFAFCND